MRAGDQWLLIHGLAPGETTAARLLQPFLQRRIDGAVVTLSGPREIREACLQRLVESACPFVLLEQRVDCPHGACVLGDNADGALRTLMEEWTRKHTKFEMLEILGKAGVPAGPVLDSREVHECEHLRARGFLVDYDMPGRGTVTFPGSPFRLSESPHVPKRPPLLGEHTDSVLSAELGLSEADIAALRERGAV